MMNKNLSELVSGDFVYLHPKSKRNYADFGIVSENNLVNGNFNIVTPFNFEFSKEYGIWIPFYLKALENATMVFGNKDLRRYELYTGLGEIQEGMQENNNPNYNLVSAVLDILSKKIPAK
jgi:hypothetical protein